jgi:hypothetical protein
MGIPLKGIGVLLGRACFLLTRALKSLTTTGKSSYLSFTAFSKVMLAVA